MKQGLYLVFEEFKELIDYLSAKVIFYVENRAEPWDDNDGPCTTIAGMPGWLNNLRCLLLSEKMATLKLLQRDYI
jgi:hypothetical protein